MADESKLKARLIMVALWLVILGGLTAVGYFFVLPHLNWKFMEDTGSETKYTRGNLTIAADSFSGYAVLRSDRLKESLKAQGIRLVIEDDKADYQARIASLRDGTTEMAVFTVDSLIAASAALGEFPATIVLVLDESNGADAIISHGGAITSLQDLNHPETKFVLTRASPSEFLARIVVSHFSVTIPESRWVSADGATDVANQFRVGDKTARRAYVLWEPDLSRALDTDDATVLIDSSKIKGYIVDVLAVSRSFLASKPDVVLDVVEAYLRTSFSYSQEANGLATLIAEDAKRSGQTLSAAQSAKLTTSIAWKNTVENYAHFGLLDAQDAKGLQSLEDIVANVSRVLVQTGALATNPLGGRESTLYYDRILKDLQEKKFHPGRVVNVLQNEFGAIDDETVHGVVELPALEDAQWNQLVQVGEMRVPPIQFGRGKAAITINGQRDLDSLIQNLRAWPTYYLKVVGNASAQGDAAANAELARKRADAVTQYLLSGGVGENRVRAIAASPRTGGTGSQSVVTFVLGQLPY